MNLPGRARIGHLGRRGRPAGEQAGCAADRQGPGQSQALYDRLRGPRQLVGFTAAEGANRHCEPMGLAVRDTRVFDWLDRYLAA